MSDPVTFTTRALGLDHAPVPAYADPHSRAVGRLQHDLRAWELEVARMDTAIAEATAARDTAERNVSWYKHEIERVKKEDGNGR